MKMSSVFETAVCDPKCSGGCATNGPGKCDSDCFDGYGLNQATQTCAGKTLTLSL